MKNILYLLISKLTGSILLKNPSSNIFLLETLYQKYGLYPLQNGGERRTDKIRFEVFIRGAGRGRS